MENAYDNEHNMDLPNNWRWEESVRAHQERADQIK